MVASHAIVRDSSYRYVAFCIVPVFGHLQKELLIKSRSKCLPRGTLSGMRSNTPNAKAPLWVGAAFCTTLYLLAIAGLVLFDREFQRPVPLLDQIAFVLFSPAWLLMFTRLESPWFEIAGLTINCFFWGILPTIALRRWLPWPFWRFSLRAMLIVTTLVAVLLGLVCYAIR